MLGPLLIEAFRYNKWANGYLLDVCSGLGEDRLGWTANGTYGTIADTFMHLLAAEQRYIWRLGGDQASLSEPDPFPGFAALKRHAETSGDRLIELAANLGPDDEVSPERRGDRRRLLAGVVLIQAMHHGNDHRTHICTILGTHGVDYGPMDVWAYGESLGANLPAATAR